MKFRTQKIAYWFFASALLLFVLQIVYGFIMGFAHMGYDVLHDYIPFNTARAVHTNLLVFWLLLGFMGAAHFIIPEEADREIAWPRLAYVQLISFLLVGVTAIVCYHMNIWEGRKFLEIPRPLDYLVVINILVLLANIGRTIWNGKRFTTTAIVLYMGLLCAALLYLPGMIEFENQTVDSFYRWWVVHLWVEGVWELIMGGILCFLLIKLTGVDREIIEKWLYIIVGFSLFSGLLGTGHHYYWIGTPEYWHWIGAIFSVLEVVPFFAMILWAFYLVYRSGRNHPNKAAMLWSLGCPIMAFFGAGVLGLMHSFPSINYYTHGTQLTAAHGHLAFYGAYVMLNLAFFTYALPALRGLQPFNQILNMWSFWLMTGSMVFMTMTLAFAGVIQTHLQRVLGMGFMEIQAQVDLFYWFRLGSGLFFLLGALLFIYATLGPVKEQVTTSMQEHAK